MDKTNALQRLGFGKSETRIYLAMLGAGALTVAEIAKRALLHRPDVYRTIPRLVESGLITKSIKGKRVVFRAEHPHKLKAAADRALSDLDTLIPELESEFQSSEKRPIVKYLEGTNGIRSFFLDLLHTLKRDEIYYRYGSSNMPGLTAKYVPANYREMRDKKGLGRYIITDEASARYKKPALNRDLKIAPKKFELFNYNVSLYIYGNKVAYVDYQTETVIIIENKTVAEFQRKIFKMTYDLL